MEKLRSPSVTTCRKCGAALAGRPGVGRPAWYCSTGCRRAAEYELRRAQDALATVEKRAREHREQIALESVYGLNCCGRGQALVRHLEGIEAERMRLESRMQLLLDDGQGAGDE